MPKNDSQRVTKQSNVKKGVQCELVELHTINKEKPTEKLVGRKRKAVEEEGKEHYPITAGGLRDPLSVGNLIESWAEMRPSILAFSTSFCVMEERTQLVAEEFLAMMFLVARCFMRIYHAALGGYARTERGEEISNGGGRENELVNSKIPHYAAYIPSGRRIMG
jgi:hypothetical protein